MLAEMNFMNVCSHTKRQRGFTSALKDIKYNNKILMYFAALQAMGGNIKTITKCRVAF
jgi:hypothetical protein